MTWLPPGDYLAVRTALTDVQKAIINSYPLAVLHMFAERFHMANRAMGRGPSSVVSMVDLQTANSAAATRLTRHINRKPASNIYHAVRIADAIGTALNHLITINFTLTSCSPGSASVTWQRLLARHFTPWVRRPPRQIAAIPAEPAYVWVIENTGGIALHWLVHVPEHRLRDLEAKLPKWLSQVGATPVAPSAIDIRKARTPKGAVAYMLKGTNPIYSPGLGVRHEPQGEVLGKRSGFSRSLGPTRKLALRAAGLYASRRYAIWPTQPPHHH